MLFLIVGQQEQQILVSLFPMPYAFIIKNNYQYIFKKLIYPLCFLSNPIIIINISLFCLQFMNKSTNIIKFEKYKQFGFLEMSKDFQNSKISASNIKVFCRFRPFNEIQIESSNIPIQKIMSQRHLTIKDSFNKHQEMSFLFDKVFDSSVTQAEIYDEIGEPVLNNILDGFNGTIMAYGQTSSGKTHTMQGSDLNSEEFKGLIPRIIQNLFDAIQKSPENLQFKLKVSLFEVYMEKVRDLLDITKTDLKIRENKHGPYVQHLTEVYIGQQIQFFKLLHLGQKNRVTCATNMNTHSSRSHMILLLTLNQFNLETSQSKTSKLFLVDLAGSEKVSKTGAEGLILEQAKKINLSLASLGKVIKGLSTKINHIPYRDSKLTRIIKDSLGGNSKTTLIVTCSPHEYHLSETLSTLRFGESAQKIKNKPKINRELTVEELQGIIEHLENTLDDKIKWIKILENYIRSDLAMPLPALPASKLRKFRHTQNLHSISNLESTEQYLFYGKENKDTILAHSLQFPTTCEYSLISQNNDDRYSILQSQLATVKANLKSQLNKFYNLKKEHHCLNQNMKQLMSQNLALKQNQKLLTLQIQTIRQEVLKKSDNFYKQLEEQFSIKEDKANFVKIIQQKYQIFYEDLNKIQFHNNQQLQDTFSVIQFQSLHSKKDIRKNGLVPFSSHNVSEQLLLNQSSFEEEDVADKLIRIEEQFNDLRKQQSFWKIDQQVFKRQLKIKEDKIARMKKILKQISQQTELIIEEVEDDVKKRVKKKIVRPIKGGSMII